MKLVTALEGTQVLGTLICGFGVIVPSIGWALIIDLWLFNLLEMLILDMAKVATYRWVIGGGQRDWVADQRAQG